jgi:hypothetical protein
VLFELQVQQLGTSVKFHTQQLVAGRDVTCQWRGRRTLGGDSMSAATTPKKEAVELDLPPHAMNGV